jgi:hypothetical protein
MNTMGTTDPGMKRHAPADARRVFDQLAELLTRPPGPGDVVDEVETQGRGHRGRSRRRARRGELPRRSRGREHDPAGDQRGVRWDDMTWIAAGLAERSARMDR